MMTLQDILPALEALPKDDLIQLKAAVIRRLLSITAASIEDRSVQSEEAKYTLDIFTPYECVIRTIREVRELTGHNLLESKELVERSIVTPQKLWNTSLMEVAQAIKMKFESIGAHITIRENK